MNDNKKYEEMKEVKVFVGIDIGKEKHFVSLINKEGRTLITGFELTNTLEGFENLVKMFELNGSPKDIAIGFEPTGHYWKALGYFLNEKGYRIFLINPYHVKLSKELRDNRQRKTDKKDSALICNLLREGKYLNTLLLDEEYELLRRLTLLRDKILEDNKRIQIRLITLLDEYLPEYVGCFSQLKGKASIGLLNKYGISGLRFNDKRDEIIKDIRYFSKKRISEQKSCYIEKVLRESVGLKRALIASEMELRTWIDELSSNMNKLKNIESKIEDVLDKTEEGEYLLSIKGVGIITIANILGQTGSFKNYKSYKQIEKLAGLDLIENSSGKKVGEKKISKRGRDKLRCSLYQVSVSCIAKNKELKNCYDKKVKEQKKNKMVALTSVSIKVLRIMFSLVKNKSLYDSTKVS